MQDQTAVTIRRAEIRDIPCIHELLRQVCQVHHEGRPDLFKAGGRKYTDEELIELLADDKRPVFVAEAAGRVEGYVFCVFEEYAGSGARTDMKELYIDDLCVDEGCRGRHIGQQLFNYAERFARESGCYELTLNVWSCNTAAMGFYEAQGLKPQKVHLEKLL